MVVEENPILLILEKSNTKFEKWACKYGGGIVLKDDQVYMFGGFSSFLANSCEAFDLKLKEWKLINTLPIPCLYITAAVLNNEIILSGLHFDCCYSYNNSNFTSILPLSGNCYKLICEGWIFSCSILYENEECDN